MSSIFLFFYAVLILEVNGIIFEEASLIEAPKILDEYVVSKMIYYMDTHGDYYYPEEFRKKTYNDKVEDSIKDPSNEASESSFGFLSADLRFYLDELVRKILADNQVREEMIIVHIDSVTKESEESQGKLRSELKAKMQDYEAQVTTQVDFVKVVVGNLGRSNIIFKIGYTNISEYPYVTIITPTSDDAYTIT